MSKVLILCAHRPNRSPSQRYRFEQYLSFLKQNGFEFTWSFLLNEKDDVLFYSKGNFFQKVIILLKTVLKRLFEMNSYKNYDIIFIQREAQFLGTSFFEKRAFKSGAKVIFDFDDSIWLADTSPGNKKFEFVKKPQKFFNNLKFAHVVFAGNDYLKQKAEPFNSNTILIPTTIDTDFHKPFQKNNSTNKIIIGWSGSISTIKHFEMLESVLEKIQKKYADEVEIKIIGQGNYKSEKLKVTSVGWSADTEVQELNSFDIGIMPLPNDEWANGKCGLKGLSYMACGVSTVMSNVGVNNKLIEHGKNGFLCSNDAEWLELLEVLIQNKLLRETLGEQGRKTIEREYSVNANKDKYLQVFKNLSQGNFQ